MASFLFLFPQRFILSIFSSCRHRNSCTTPNPHCCKTSFSPSLSFRLLPPPLFYCSAICEFAKKKKPKRRKKPAHQDGAKCKQATAAGCRGEKSQREKDLRFFFEVQKGGCFSAVYCRLSSAAAWGCFAIFNSF